MSGAPSLSINVLESVEEVSTFWAWLTKPREWIAVDTETTGINVHEPGFRVRMLQFGDTEGGWAIDFQQWREVCRQALLWAQAHRVILVWHNALFDLSALSQEGIDLDWSLVGDTFVLAAIDGYADQSRALKDIGFNRFGAWATAGQSVLHRAMKANGWTWATIPMDFQPYPIYGVVDTVLTGLIWEQWWGTRDRWADDHDMEVGVLRLSHQMMRRGVGLDGSYILAEIGVLDEEEREISARLLAHGITSASNNAEIGAALQRAGVVLSSRTGTGRISVSKDVLADVNHPIARDVIRARYVSRVRTTYLGGLMKSAGGEVGRSLIHPSIQPIEARTGRMSVSNPPMQQLPRDNPLARNAIVPRMDGEVLVTADYGQIELRMWARLMRDEALANVLRTADESKGDFFVEVGRDVYRDPTFAKSDPRRTLIKGVTYGTIYGAGVPTMAASAGVSEEVMEPIAAALKERYASFRSLGSDLVQQGWDGGAFWSVTTPFGRTIKVRRRDEARKLPNYLDQGSSAVVLKRALLRADAAGIGDHLMLPVHDEILLSVPERDAEEASMILKQSMDGAANEGMDDFGVRITADPSAPGLRWGSLAK